jgi:hypothetical protein
MKKLNIKSLILLPAVLMFLGLSSCLDDTGYLDIFNGENAGPVVSFGQADHGYVIRTVEVKEEAQDISLNVNVARAEEDVTVTIEMDPALLDAYNAEQAAADPAFVPYELLPDSAYSIPTTSVTVPKGSLDAPFSISVFSTEISLDYAYILPLKITTSTGNTVVATNLSTALVSVGVKNAYDGIYAVRGGNIQRNSATGPDPVLSGNFAPTIEISMSTRTANSVYFQPTWKDGSGIAGIDNTYLTVDPATNLVVVASEVNPALKNTPTLTNSYDPATRTFTLNFDWGSGASTRVITNYKLEWIGPRP